MAVQTQVVRFQKDTSGTPNATQDVALNFTPKAIILFSDGSNADNTVSDHFFHCQGFSDGTNHVCITSQSDDADAAADVSQSAWNNSVYMRATDTANTSIVQRASCVFQTNNIRFTWVVNDTVATYITIYAIGGSDITNVLSGIKQIGADATETIDYTGLGWNPAGNGHSVLFAMTTSFITGNENTIFGNGHVELGCAVSNTQQFTNAIIIEDAADPTDTWRYFNNAACVSPLSNSGVLSGHASFNSWITDGWRLDWTETGTLLAGLTMPFMVIEGGTWDTGSLQSPTTPTNNVDYAVAVSSNTLRGLLISSCATGTQQSMQTISVYTTGATDGTNQACVGMIDEDAQATTDSYRVNNGINILRPLTTDGAAMDTATFDSFTTNNFRLDWGAADATARYYGWVVVADTTPAAVVTEEISYKSFGSLQQSYTNNTGYAIFG